MNYHKLCKHIDVAYGCRIAKELSLIGNDGSSLGFRNAGSTGEKKAAAYIVREMQKAGLRNIITHSFAVDSWEFKGCTLSYQKSGKRISYPLSAFAGVNGTGGKPIKARIVNAEYGTYEDCKRADLHHSIAFIKADLSKEYWLGQPAYQLELSGALAVIVMLDGDAFGTCREALNSGDCIARPDLPIVNISKEDGEKLISDLEDEEIIAELFVDCVLAKGESQNITGEIPGKQADACIMIGGHYDGYFRAYIDDAFAIGVMMAMAKAIMDSEQKPSYTIRFIAHGAEEFGVADSHCDWCIGSWQQITNLMPQWRRQVKLFLNIDAVNPDAEEFLIQAAPQLHDFIENSMADVLDEIKPYWPAGYVVDDVNGPWSDDFSYYMAGIPVAICGRGKSEWRKKYYHTNYDSCDDLHEVLLGKIAYLYMKMVCDFDHEKLPPVRVARELRYFTKAIDVGFFQREGIDVKKLKDISQELELFMDAEPSIAAEIGGKLIKEIRGLRFDDELTYRLDGIQKNLALFDELARHILGVGFDGFGTGLGAADGTGLDAAGTSCSAKRVSPDAMESRCSTTRADPDANAVSVGSSAAVNFSAVKANLHGIEIDFGQMEKIVGWFSGSSIIRDFTDAVYEYWCIKALDEEEAKLQWAAGLMEQPIDVRTLYWMIREKATPEKIIHEVTHLKEIERQKAKRYVEKLINTMTDMLDEW